VRLILEISVDPSLSSFVDVNCGRLQRHLHNPSACSPNLVMDSLVSHSTAGDGGRKREPYTGKAGKAGSQEDLEKDDDVEEGSGRDGELDGAGEDEDGDEDEEGDEEEEDYEDDDGVGNFDGSARRSLRPSNLMKRAVGDLKEEGEEEVDFESEDFHQPCLSSCLPAVQKYFFLRLEEIIQISGGSTHELQGWRVQVLKRTGGLTLGLLDVFYYNNRGKRFRTRVEVACFMNLMPVPKNLRGLTREQLHMNAIETRERHIISQQLALCDFACEEILGEGDVVTVIPNSDTRMDDRGGPELSQDTSSSAEATAHFNGMKKASKESKNYFSFGNTVILDWGRLVPDAPFHTATQLFPIGFKCLRQEHDVTLDRVIDCLCEIDAVYDGGDGASVLKAIQGEGLIEVQHKPLSPLFRLSVAWHIGDESSIGTAREQDFIKVRVYEARSPQQAWQAAMLEGLGIKDESLLAVNLPSVAGGGNGFSPTAHHATDLGIDPLSGEEAWSMDAGSFEDQDEEELELRVKIREQRRAYFRVLRAEQSAGIQAAVKPRLSLDSVDSFAEEIVMRMIEGQEGSAACRNYHYLDSRDREAGRKNMLKGYTRAFSKAKNLDRVIRKNVYVAEQLQLLDQKRKRVEEQETRKRAKIEDKETRTLVVAAQKARNAKIREIEKNITLLKVSLAKAIKKRREEAKTMADVVCDKEELVRISKSGASEKSRSATPVAVESPPQEAPAWAPPRPEPLECSVFLDGPVFGQLLEVVEYLHSFGEAHQPALRAANIGIPSIMAVASAVKVCDPVYRILKDYTRSLERSYDFVTQHQPVDPTPAEAAELLNKMGSVLCASSMREFERILGIEQAETQVGSVRIPINTLTWREIARVVLLTACARELGQTDQDIAAMLKGRGFYTSPESADRKTLKLARRRIKFAHATRSELQESVYGFSMGMCVRIPAPNTPLRPSGVMWTQLVGSLERVPDRCSWLIFEVIKGAALSVCSCDSSSAARRLQRSLMDCLSTDFHADHGQTAKGTALRILAKWVNNGPVEVGKLDAGEGEDAQGLRANDLGQNLMQLVYDQSPYMVPLSTFDVWAKQLREAIRHVSLAPADSRMSLSALDVTREEVDEVDEIVELVVEVEDGAEVVAKAPRKRASLVQEPKDIEDAESASMLSTAMMRCYLVIRDLMAHPHANPFNWPVDPAIIPGYYKLISQPLSLSEVRKALVEDRYHDSIFKFYCDVVLVIENALAYNQENSVVKLSAQKILIVFERIFFETVLCWDNPLPFHDSCHFCRSHQPIASNKVAVCDRCEGSYHLYCLDPPMQTPPRSEWYCLPCVEQKGISTAHPYKTADVRHPIDPDARGEVVGMEQIRQTAMFVVEFGNVREMWDARKVRRYALVEKSASKEEDGEKSSESSDPRDEDAKSVYTMPSGYEYEDFDRVCGIARAYTGWGASHYLVPSSIMDEHNLSAIKQSSEDMLFVQYRDAVAALGPTAGGTLTDETSMEEWGAILSSLLHRSLEFSNLNSAFAEFDEHVDDDLVAQIQEGVQCNSLSLDTLFGFLRGEGLIKSVKSTADAPSKGRAKGKGRIRKRASNASGAGDAQDDDEVDEEGEEEEGVEDEEDEEEEEDDWDEPLVVDASKKKPVKAPVKSAKNGKIAVDDEDEEEEFDEEVYNAHDVSVIEDAEDDEEDLEFYDENGKCLTSSADLCDAPVDDAPDLMDADNSDNKMAIAEGQAPEDAAAKDAGPDSDEQWDMRFLSRQKGREDALLTHSLVLDALSEIDVDGSKEKDEDQFKHLTNEELGGDFYSTAVSSIVKSCLARPSETLAAHDWCEGWGMKMEALGNYLEVLEEERAPLTCSVCGFDEGFLGSPFVWGQSSEEWEADVEANTAQDVLTEPEPPTEANAFPLAAGVSTSSGIKGFRARYRVMKGLVWKPVNVDDGNVEERECSSRGRILKAGSKVMHECCAHFTHFNRQMKQNKSRKVEEQRMVEILSGLWRSKSTTLGSDRDGSFYWVMRGSNALLVSTGGAESLREKAALADAAQKEHPTRWSIYRNIAEIGEVIHWLDPNLPCERILRKLLSLLYPGAVPELETDEEFVLKPTEAEAKEPTEEALGAMVVGDEDIDISDIPRRSSRNEVVSGVEAAAETAAATAADYARMLSTRRLEIVAEQRQLALREAAASRPAIVNRNRWLNGYAPIVERVPSKVKPSFKYRKNDHVLVDASPFNHILWDARVSEMKMAPFSNDILLRDSSRGKQDAHAEEYILYYKVRFDRWGQAYDGWYEESQLIPANAVLSAVGRSKISARNISQESRMDYLRDHVWSPPEILQTLLASKYMDEPNRACGPRPPLSFSDSRTSIGQLRLAMLMIESALPVGAIDDSDDRWGEDFVVPWREAVMVAGDAVGLMQCQLMLEYGIRTAWLKPTGLKLFSCLPSRVHCIRNATIGLVAIRVWVLDQTVKYDQTKSSEKTAAGRGRPPSKGTTTSSGAKLGRPKKSSK